MVDTQLSILQLLALAADNTTGQISPQDLRDIIVSLRPGGGQMVLSAQALTSITTINTWTKVAGTTVVGEVIDANWSMPVDNRLLYGGVANRLAQVNASFSAQSATNGQEFHFAVALNGVVDEESAIHRYFVLAAENAAASIIHFIDIAAGDYLEFYCKNITSNNDVTVTSLSYSVLSLPQ